MSKALAILTTLLLSWSTVTGVARGETPKHATASSTSEAVTVTVVSGDPMQPGVNVTYGSVQLGEYWLGVRCFPVMPPLRAQLNLPEKQGLLVAAVVPDSPAAKAGVVQHDILLRVGDRPLVTPRDLVDAVDAAKGAAVKIELIHAGARKTVEATPAKRPELAPGQGPLAAEGPDWEMMQKWTEGMLPGEAAGARPPMRFRIFHPGAIVPKDVLVKRPFPANLSVVISKEGDQPAKITVKRGEEKWELTEKELDKLPADVRPHVDHMLGRGVFGIVSSTKAFDIMPDITTLPGPVPGPNGQMMSAAFQIPLNPHMEKRFDDLNRRIDQLFKAVEEMRGAKQPPAKTPEKSGPEPTK